MSIFKDIIFFRLYRKDIKKNKQYLFDNFNIKVDKAYRMYTVINLPIDEIRDYDLNANDLQKIAKPFLEEYVKNLRKYLDDIGLSELYDFYEFKKLNKYSYLMIIGYNKFKSDKYYNTLKVIYATLGLVGLITFIAFL